MTIFLIGLLFTNYYNPLKFKELFRLGVFATFLVVSIISDFVTFKIIQYLH